MIDATTAVVVVVVVVEITELLTGHHNVLLVGHHGRCAGVRRQAFQVSVEIATSGAANVVGIEEIPGRCLMVVMLGRRRLVDAQRVGRHDRPVQVSIKLLNAVETSRTAASLFPIRRLLLLPQLKSAPAGPAGQ